MGRVVEEPEPVLLGVEEVLQAGRAQRRPDRVRLLGVALPGGERAERRVGRVAGGADDAVPERARDLDLVVAVGRVDHRLQAALVAAGRDEARGVERLPDLLRRDRAVGALVEREELEASVADARQVLEDRREAARKRRQRTEVGRVLGKVAAAEIAADRPVQTRDRSPAATTAGRRAGHAGPSGCRRRGRHCRARAPWP